MILDRMRYLTPLIIVALAIGAAGCGQRQLTPEAARIQAGQEATTIPPLAPQSVRKATTVLVSMKGSRFLPNIVTAQVGDTIKWTNQDTVSHTVTGGPFRSAAIAPGESYQVVVNATGKIDYACTIHPGMVGQVVVNENAQ